MSCTAIVPHDRIAEERDMADDHARDELAQLRTLVETQQARLARLERPRHRLPRRFLPLALVALLVLLTPLSLLAAAPFNDLTGGVHDANIGLIYDAGITTGCVPNVSYCPTDNVTREEMATFLARTAGLGTNPPVVNAKTAQTAGSATTATSATNATHAASADTATSATSAQNAGTLGGQPPSAYLPSTGDTTYRYAGTEAHPLAGTTFYGLNGELTIRLGPSIGTAVVMPLPHATAEYGRSLAIKSVRVCYSVETAFQISKTELIAAERGAGDRVNLSTDNTTRTSTTITCYDLTLGTPRTVAGPTSLNLYITNTSSDTNHSVTLYSFDLVLTPLGAGAAEVPPVAAPAAPAKP